MLKPNQPVLIRTGDTFAGPFTVSRTFKNGRAVIERQDYDATTGQMMPTPGASVAIGLPIRGEVYSTRDGSTVTELEYRAEGGPLPLYGKLLGRDQRWRLDGTYRAPLNPHPWDITMHKE